MAEKLKITLVKSPIGAIPKQKATVAALGLNKTGKTIPAPNSWYSVWSFPSTSPCGPPTL